MTTAVACDVVKMSAETKSRLLRALGIRSATHFCERPIVIDEAVPFNEMHEVGEQGELRSVRYAVRHIGNIRNTKGDA